MTPVDLSDFYPRIRNVTTVSRLSIANKNDKYTTLLYLDVFVDGIKCGSVAVCSATTDAEGPIHEQIVAVFEGRMSLKDIKF